MGVLVSVCLLTYQQEDTISEAIESVMRQKTDFSFELIVGDDHSTDRTVQIIERYKNLYKEQVTLISQPQNIGPVRNAFSVLQKAKGTYLAFLEGDDFWTSSTKLQQQVDYLRMHPACSMVYHACNVIDDKGNVLRTLRQKHQIHSLPELYPTGNIHMATGSIVGINLFQKNPSYFRYCGFTHYVGDIILKAAYLKEGSIGYIDQVFSCYRRITSGKDNYSSLDINIQRVDAIKAYRAVMYLYGFKEIDGVTKMQVKVIRDVISSLFAQKHFLAAFKFYFCELTCYERSVFRAARKQDTI